MAADMLTTAEVARELNVSVRTIENWRRQSRNGEQVGPPFVRLGKSDRAKVRYPRADMRRWLALNSNK